MSLAQSRHPVLATANQGPQGPSFRVRCTDLSRSVAAFGVDLSPAPLFTAEEARRFPELALAPRAALTARASLRLRRQARDGGRNFETVIVSRQVDHLPGLGLEKAVIGDARLVYDVDDAIWLDRRGAGGHSLALLKRTEAKVRWLTRRADIVVAGNEILAEHLTQLSDRVEVVPSLVDTEAAEVRAHAEGETLTLGWLGSPTTASYLESLIPTLDSFAGVLAPMSVRLLVVGGEIAPGSGSVAVECRPWSRRAEQGLLRSIDVGLMPLPDTPWTRGKCAFKALQYMAAGIPVVADDVGVVRPTIGPGGIVAAERSEWIDALEALARSVALRARTGEAGRAQAEASFSYRAWAPRIAEIWRGE